MTPDRVPMQMAEKPVKSPGRRIAGAFGHALLHPTHTLAHGVGNLVQPLVNASQYRTFRHPEKNRAKINREMFRTFQTASRSTKQDARSAIGLAALLVLGGVAGEHVPIPISHFGLPPGIPTPFEVNLQFPIPTTEALNHIPFFHLPTEVNYHEYYWPLFTSDFVTSGINVVNAVRAHKEKRPIKRFWYGLSALACFTHIPVVFNSIWYEVATAGPQRISRRTFAKNAELVLSGKTDIPENKPLLQHIKDALRGEIEVNPKERHVFVDAVNKQFTPERPKKLWEELLTVNGQITRNALTDHEEKEEKITLQKKNVSHIRRLIGWPKQWAQKSWHHFLAERDSDKLEAIHAAEKFIIHTEEKQN